MTTYEFLPNRDSIPVFVINITSDEVTTKWRDIEGHFNRMKYGFKDNQESHNTRIFMTQLRNFWRNVCNMEEVDEVIDAIIASVKNPDLIDFLIENR